MCKGMSGYLHVGSDSRDQPANVALYEERKKRGKMERRSGSGGNGGEDGDGLLRRIDVLEKRGSRGQRLPAGAPNTLALTQLPKSVMLPAGFMSALSWLTPCISFMTPNGAKRST